MKKVFFAFALAVVISMGFISCRKCEVCTKDSSPEVRICKEDYGSNTEYGLALDALQATGYNCR